MATSYKHPGSSQPRAVVVLAKEQFSWPSKNPYLIRDEPVASRVIILPASIPGLARKYRSGFRNPLVNIWPHLSFQPLVLSGCSLLVSRITAVTRGAHRCVPEKYPHSTVVLL
ncbi:unnamed protein product [Cuscuta europaea]|uniref:Uncharacterized protein n=1 Tax=Cuscuta europaea TaxID=41803 RepID=A0A9P0ZNY3_CUSEU|nr:unnamed protein product [Cuscuta europaea]